MVTGHRIFGSQSIAAGFPADAYRPSRAPTSRLDGSSNGPKSRSLCSERSSTDLQKFSTSSKDRTLPTHVTNEETETQKGEVICLRSHSTKAGLETGRLTLLPPISPLHCLAPSPCPESGQALKCTLTPSCCRTAANPTTLETGDLKAIRRGWEGGAARQRLVQAITF